MLRLLLNEITKNANLEEKEEMEQKEEEEKEELEKDLRINKGRRRLSKNRSLYPSPPKGEVEEEVISTDSTLMTTLRGIL
jgi:hypothetical protein